MDNFQKNPLKLYIQDIFRATRTQSKYIYEFYGMTFKNIMIHGVITSVYNTTKTTMNIELSDATGSVHIYFDKTKNNLTITDSVMRNLLNDFEVASKFGDSNIIIMNNLMDRIVQKRNSSVKEGDYLNVIGDIFLDETRNVRMVSAYECTNSSVECDIVWMEELRYLYEKYYLGNNKENG